MASFDDITLYGKTSLSDLFKQIHKNNKDVDAQINGLIEQLKPLASNNAGSAVMLMPTVKDLIDVNVKNNDQLIKMAGIAQRAAIVNSNSGESLFDMSEIQSLLDEQRAVVDEGAKLLETTNNIQKQIS